MTLKTPFLYRPSQGNLLLDLIVPKPFPEFEDPWSGYIPPFFSEAVDETGDETSSLVAIPSSSKTAQVVCTAGLVMEFVLAPLPRIYAYVSGNDILLYFPARPFGLRVQSREVTSGSPWSDYKGSANVLGGQDIEDFYTLYAIPLSSLKAPTLFRLFWNSPQVGLPGVAAPPEFPGDGVETEN